VTAPTKTGKTTFITKALIEYTKNGGDSYVFQAEMLQDEFEALVEKLDRSHKHNLFVEYDCSSIDKILSEIGKVCDQLPGKTPMFLIDSAQFIGDGRGNTFSSSIKVFRDIARTRGCIICFINHLSKTGDQLGSSNIQFLASSITKLEREKAKTNAITISVKNRNMKSGEYSGYIMTEEGIIEDPLSR